MVGRSLALDKVGCGAEKHSKRKHPHLPAFDFGLRVFIAARQPPVVGLPLEDEDQRGDEDKSPNRGTDPMKQPPPSVTINRSIVGQCPPHHPQKIRERVLGYQKHENHDAGNRHCARAQ